MIIRIFFTSLIVCVGMVPGWLFAVGDDFIISTLIGGDTTAPTTPVLQSVTPVASTQIDITWSASTDDLSVAGYRLFRDSVQIATTTLLTYSDTGLTPSTTYQYMVDAFDTSYNFSSTSLPVSTTTLVAMVPPTPTSTSTSTGESSTRTTPQLVTFAITPRERSALFNWETNNPTQYVLVWGRTTAYELGSVSGSTYKEAQSTLIDSLEPGTTYYYELRVTNVRGVTIVLSTDRFTTTSVITGDTLPNVQGFFAQPQNTDVALSWLGQFSNPNYYVRVVRSHLFYPGTIQSGAVVYEGRAQSFVDVGALENRSPQYYTIFVLDGTGAVSSGAVARADRRVTTDDGSPVDPITPGILQPDMGDDSILRAADIIIMQNEQGQIFDEGITLATDVSYLISIPYGAVTTRLKSIIVSVQNPTNQKEVSAYLLKLNKAGDAYTAYIPGSPVVGTAGMMVEVFDFEQQTVRRISTTVTFVDTTLTVPFFPDRLLQYLMYLGLVCGGGLCAYWFILLWRRRRRETDS